MPNRYPYRCDPRLYENYYLNQTGHGLPVYVGGRALRGSGLGSVLGGLFRAAMPLLKQGGKALLREGARTGLDMAADVLSGQSLKSAAKRRAKQAGERLVTQAVNRVSNNTPRTAKRIKSRTHSQRGQKRGSSGQRGRKRKRTSDIFG